MHVCLHICRCVRVWCAYMCVVVRVWCVDVCNSSNETISFALPKNHIKYIVVSFNQFIIVNLTPSLKIINVHNKTVYV